LTNNIEGERLRTEEGFDGWEIVAEPWHRQAAALDKLAQGLRVAADQPLDGALDVSSDLVRLRAPLTQPEIERYRALGHDAGAALAQAAETLQRGMTEHALAGAIARATYAIGAVPIVVLVASDERLETIRHPLPTEKRIERVAMLVLCARRQGLITSLTRLVHFGRAPEELQRRMAAAGQIDATTIAATRPGARFADIFARLQRAYAEVGFDGEWRNHHQGGPCSYDARDYVVTPGMDGVVHAPQAFAWNPSVPGAKSEDTVLITDRGAEILTRSYGWPMQRFTIDGQELERPDVLEL
jgi:antitoxin VapB